MDQTLTVSIPQWYQNWPIVMVGLGVGTLVFLVGRLFLRPQKCTVSGDPGNLESPDTRDRRSDFRRTGNPVPIDLCDPAGRIDPFIGWVSDRSRGGLALTVECEVPIGTVLEIRLQQNQEIFPVPIRVCSCRRSREGYILGSQFVQTPPWNVLLLLG
jgi:hypothetical protein